MRRTLISLTQQQAKERVQLNAEMLANLKVCHIQLTSSEIKEETEGDGLIELNLDSEEAIRLETCIIYAIFVIFFLFVFIFVIYLVRMKSNHVHTADEVTRF